MGWFFITIIIYFTFQGDIVSCCSSSVTISNTTWFLRLRLYFDLYTRLISFSLSGAYKILRPISPLFFPNFLCSYNPAGKFISSQLYLLIWGLIFDILSGWLPISWWFSATVIAYWKHLLSLVFLGFIVAFLIDIQSGYFMYDLSLLSLMLWKWMPSMSTLSNI